MELTVKDCDSFVQWHRYVKMNELLNPVQTDFSAEILLEKSKRASGKRFTRKQKKPLPAILFSFFLELCHINFNEAKCLSALELYEKF